MSAETHAGDVRINVTRWAVIAGFLAVSSALFGSFILLPHRVDQVEKEQQRYESQTDLQLKQQDMELRQQREILIRIDENVKDMRRTLNHQ